MLEVAGKPIIGHIVERLMAIKPERVCVVVPPGDRTIADYLRRSFPLDFRFVVQPEPKGLADAVRCAEGEVAGLPVLVFLGDTILDIDFPALFALENALGVKAVADPSRFGVVFVENGVIRRVIEKPKEPVSNLAIVGVYFFTNARPLFVNLERLVQQDRRVGREYQFTDVLQMMSDEGIKIRVMTVDNWFDCGTPEALLETNRVLLERMGSKEISPDAQRGSGEKQNVFLPPVWIAPGAIIERSVVGPFVSVSAGARIVNAVVREALVYQNSWVEGVVVNRGIIGEGAKLQGRVGMVNVGPGEERDLS